MRIRSWNYSSMEPLYRGPLGVVSKARCETKGGRFDAITALDERLARDETLQALDGRMARVGGLRSPLLVRDKGLVEVDGRICLASVLVDGVPLRYIVGQRPLPPRLLCTSRLPISPLCRWTGAYPRRSWSRSLRRFPTQSRPRYRQTP